MESKKKKNAPAFSSGARLRLFFARIELLQCAYDEPATYIRMRLMEAGIATEL